MKQRSRTIKAVLTATGIALLTTASAIAQNETVGILIGAGIGVLVTVIVWFR